MNPLAFSQKQILSKKIEDFIMKELTEQTVKVWTSTGLEDSLLRQVKVSKLSLFERVNAEVEVIPAFFFEQIISSLYAVGYIGARKKTDVFLSATACFSLYKSLKPEDTRGMCCENNDEVRS